MKNADPTTLVLPLAKEFNNIGINYKNGPNLEAIIAIQAERTKTLREMASMSRYFFEEFEAYDEKAAHKNLKPEIVAALTETQKRMQSLEHWDKKILHQIIIDVAEQFELKLGKLAQPIRVAVTGNTVSPPIDITLELLGKERVLIRLNRALEWITAAEIST